ncbi:MAG: hypothetical protein OSB19_15770 [Opitutaceae bacterium]|nr:hypothetical protein [Opitutaceae bacterium]
MSQEINEQSQMNDEVTRDVSVCDRERLSKRVGTPRSTLPMVAGEAISVRTHILKEPVL